MTVAGTGEIAGQTPEPSAIPWSELRARAQAMAARAYRPYSGLGVGAAALVAPDLRGASPSGQRIVAGANVENASYGLTLCAECSLVSDLIGSGGGRLIAVVVCDSEGLALAPCGRCRQLLHEHGGSELLVDFTAGAVRLGALLPEPFGPGDLP